MSVKNIISPPKQSLDDSLTADFIAQFRNRAFTHQNSSQRPAIRRAR